MDYKQWIEQLLGRYACKTYSDDLAHNLDISSQPLCYPQEKELRLIGGELFRTDEKEGTKLAIKLAATDLDGTLIASWGEISTKNFEAMEKAMEDGLYVVPTTGRSFYEMPQSLRDRKAFTHCICSNGAVIFNRDGSEIWKSTFSKEKTIELFDMLSQYDTMIEVYTKGIPVTEKSKLTKEAYEHFRVEENYHDVLTTTRKGVDDLRKFLEENDEGAEMFNIFFSDAQERKEAFDKIGSLDCTELTTSMQSNMEILQSSVNKGTSLRKLCEILGVKTQEVMAMGDSRNDLTLLGAAGLPLAVANACDALKEKAKEVICSCDESAMAFALERFVQGEK